MEVQETAAIGGDGLVVTSAETDVVAQLIVTSTELFGRGEALEPAHTSNATFNATVVLLEVNDEWQLQHCYMGTKALAELLNPNSPPASYKFHPKPPEPWPLQSIPQSPPR